MYSKFLFLLIIFLFFGCSKDENLNFQNSKKIFLSKKITPFVNEDEKNNSRLQEPKEVKQILNTKSYNLTNSLVKYPLKKLWQLSTNQSIDDENPYLPEPIYISSNIYLLNNNGYLFKINSRNGKILWKIKIFKNLENTVIGTPAISGTVNKNKTITIYAHNGSNKLVAIKGIDGSIIWKKKRKLPYRGGITTFKNFLFVSDFDGNFMAINNEKGNTLWSVYLGSDYNSVYTSARPIIAKNKIIVPATGGTFFVLSLDTGEVLWNENISSNYQLPKLFHSGDIVANPVYYKGNIYIVSQSGFTSAFNLNTSKELWNIPIGGFETPVVSGKTIFIMGNMGLLAAVDLISGKLRWKQKYPSYLNEDSFFKEEIIAVYKGPTLAGSKILISNQSGFIQIIDANNGKKINTIKVGKLAIPPIPVERQLLFLTANGKLLAYR